MTFQESDLQFNFSDADWQVIKYDTHRYFKILSGVGLKGIDFLGIYQERQVIFFEVKNFHTNKVTKDNSYQIIDNTPLFIENIIHKIEDAKRAVKVVHQYLQRKWWYRFFLNYHSFIPSFFIQQKDWYFWYRIQAIIQAQTTLVCVLWLEIDIILPVEQKQPLMDAIETRLAEAVKDDSIKIVLANLERPIFESTLRVSKR